MENKNRAGFYRESEDPLKRYFVPNSLFDINITYDNELVNLLVSAYKNLANFKEIIGRTERYEIKDDIYNFIHLCLIKESVLSSRIEGTIVTLDDALLPNPRNDKDLKEVDLNSKALKFATEKIQKEPITNFNIREIHQMLMEDNISASPGEFRDRPVKIGYDNSFIPPDVFDMQEAIDDLVKYINSDTEVDKLIKIGLIHYQFETIHPFLDGNGRVGRILMLKLLCDWGILKYPAISLSLYLKTFSSEYYENLRAVSEKGRYENWLKFFLKAVINAIRDSINAFNRISKLDHSAISRIFAYSSHSKTCQVYFYTTKKLFINVSEAAKELGFSYNTVKNAVNKLVEFGILHESKTDKKLYVYEDYLKVIRVGTEID